ncbi:MAG: hypothetical protein JJT76_10535 [Clostridiaceae bacterium]|nr:hypothetical protein [Clostridiaceae bacterium]
MSIIHIFIREAIVNIINENKELLKIPLRQKSKFEGWLKFELASYLELNGMKSVEVESKVVYRRDRTDITFFHDENPYSIELKTPNTNWKQEGINNNTRPITKNINSIVDDTKKLNSNYGIIAFVLFSVPTDDTRWKSYLDRIVEKTGIELTVENNCSIVNMPIDDKGYCDVVVCTYMSKRYHSW